MSQIKLLSKKIRNKCKGGNTNYDGDDDVISPAGIVTHNPIASVTAAAKPPIGFNTVAFFLLNFYDLQCFFKRLLLHERQ